MNKLILGLLAASGFIVLRKILTATKLKFYTKGVKLTGSGITNQKLYLVAEIVNPTFTQLTVNNVFLTIYANEKLIGRVEYNTPITIIKNGITLVNIPIKLNAGGLAYVVYDIIAKGLQAKFDVVGTVNSGGASVPIETTVNLL